MKDYRNLIIVILLIIIALIHTCRPKPKVDIVTRTTVVHDTTFFADTIVREIPISVPKIVYRDNPSQEAPDNTPDSLTYNEYTQSITDSLIDGNIVNVVEGKLISSKLKYTPLFPKLITTTITETKEVPVKVDKTSLAVGVMLPITDVEFSPKILLSLSHKRFIYQVGYNPFNRQPEAGINYKLW